MDQLGHDEGRPSRRARLLVIAAAGSVVVAVLFAGGGSGALVPPLAGSRGATSPIPPTAPTKPAVARPNANGSARCHEVGATAAGTGYHRYSGYRVAMSPRSWPTSVAAGDGGFVMGGSALLQYAGVLQRVAAVWTSSSGCLWRLRRLPSTARGRVARFVSAVSQTPTGLVALGYDVPVHDLDWSARHAVPVAWTSPDGEVWRAVALPTRRPFGLTDGIRGTPTGMVAWGSEFRRFERSSALLWWSADGSRWRPVTGPGAFAPATWLCSVSSQRGRLIAIGKGPHGTRTVGRGSWDGRRWSYQRPTATRARCPRPGFAAARRGPVEVDVVSRGDRAVVNMLT